MKKLIALLLMVVSFGISQPPNYFYTTLTNTITSTDTTCTISSSDTTYFGSRTNFYATIWDTYYSSPSHARSRGGKYETVLIESRSGLTLQIVRARMSSTAQNFNTSGRTYRISVEPLNNINDSLSTLRTDVQSLGSNDSVDIPIVTTFGGSSFAAQSTSYAGLNGAQIASSEASVTYSPIGISGRVTGMYFQSKTNTCTATSTLTFQYGDSSSASLTTTNITFTIPLNSKSQSVTGKSINLSASQIAGFKFVNSSGSGTITFPSVTLIIRTPIN